MEGKEVSASKGLPLPMLVATGLDVLIDGFLIGIGLRTGQKEGLLLTIALATEFLSLGLAITLESLGRQISRWKTLGLVLGVCALVVIGAVGGTSILAYVQVFLSAGLAALLFLVTEELLVEAHEVRKLPGLLPASSPVSFRSL